MPAKKIAERNLPTVRNEAMLKEIDPAVLRSKCRVQDVRFGPSDSEGTTETFVRIKTQSPDAQVPHFVMRKAKDDYVSATSMYRAVYYKSTSAQEKNEMEVVKRELAARSDENASGVWIPGTPDALQLADIYGIRPWVQALLDAPTTKSAYAEESRSPSSVQRLHETKSEETSTPPVAATPSRKSNRERSASPRKELTATAIKKAAKRAADKIATVAEETKEAAEDAKDAIVPDIKNKLKELPDIKSKLDALSDTVQNPISSVPKSVSKAATLAKKAAKTIKEDSTTTTNGAELFRTTVADAGSSMSDMLAQAREQVEAAVQKDAEALAETGLLPSPKRKTTRKRAAKEAALDQDQDKQDGDVKDPQVSVKRSKVEDLEIGLVQEKRKVRALVGLVIGLGATAVLPYLL